MGEGGSSNKSGKWEVGRGWELFRRKNKRGTIYSRPKSMP